MNAGADSGTKARKAKKPVMEKYTNRHGIAERYHLSLGSVKNLMRRRILPYSKIGRIVRFDVARCDEAISAFEVSSVTEHLKTTADQHSRANN